MSDALGGAERLCHGAGCNAIVDVAFGLWIWRKALTAFWERLIRNRVLFRAFYRGDADTYELRNTGENAEDIALVSALRDIGVDLEAWEAEEVEINQRTGECEFRKNK